MILNGISTSSDSRNSQPNGNWTFFFLNEFNLLNWIDFDEFIVHWFGSEWPSWLGLKCHEHSTAMRRHFRIGSQWSKLIIIRVTRTIIRLTRLTSSKQRPSSFSAIVSRLCSIHWIRQPVSSLQPSTTSIIRVKPGTYHSPFIFTSLCFDPQRLQRKPCTDLLWRRFS